MDLKPAANDRPTVRPAVGKTNSFLSLSFVSMSVGVSFGQKLMHDIVPLLLLPAAKELGDEKKEGKIEPGRCDRIDGVVDLRGFFFGAMEFVRVRFF